VLSATFSAKIAALTEGVLKAMMLSKLKVVVAVVLVLGFMATGATVLTFRTAAAQGNQPSAAEERVKAPQKQEKEKEAFTAWGKEVGGLQAGLGFHPGQKRAYSPGETVKLVVRVRNVSKQEVKFQYLREFIMETPPAVTDAEGNSFRLGRRTAGGLVHVPLEVNLAPGKEIELSELKLEPRSGVQSVHEGQWNIFGTGKFSVQYEQLAHPNIDKILDKLATGKLELEIQFKSEPPDATEKKAPQKQEQKQEKEGFTAYEFHGEVIEVGAGGAEKRIAAPTIRTVAGRPAHFQVGSEGDTLGGEPIPLGTTWSATVSELPAGKLRLDVRIERNEQEVAGKDEVRAQGTSLRVVKIVDPGEIVDLEIKGRGSDGSRTLLRLTASPSKGLSDEP
jgi:hypothetical protein